MRPPPQGLDNDENTAVAAQAASVVEQEKEEEDMNQDISATVAAVARQPMKVPQSAASGGTGAGDNMEPRRLQDSSYTILSNRILQQSQQHHVHDQ